MAESNTYGSYPIGFGALLMQNSDAMDYFASLTDVQRHAVAEECASIRTQAAMREYVEQLAKRKRQ